MHRRGLRALPSGSANLLLMDLGFILALESGGVPALRAQLRATPIDASASPEALLRIAAAELIAGEPEQARRSSIGRLPIRHSTPQRSAARGTRGRATRI